jgi:hypothetical protein
MQKVTSQRSVLIAVAAAILALFASLASAPVASASDKPAAMKVKIDGKTIKIGDRRDLGRVTKELGDDGKLRKNWGRVHFNIWTHLRGFQVDCSWGAVSRGISVTWHYVWHYRRLPSTYEFWRDTWGHCWVRWHL